MIGLKAVLNWVQCILQLYVFVIDKNNIKFQIKVSYVYDYFIYIWKIHTSFSKDLVPFHDYLLLELQDTENPIRNFEISMTSISKAYFASSFYPRSPVIGIYL